jgi:hypothetical protein
MAMTIDEAKNLFSVPGTTLLGRVADVWASERAVHALKSEGHAVQMDTTYDAGGTFVRGAVHHHRTCVRCEAEKRHER